MNTGMLWFDNDPKSDLPTKISRAADYYLKKYGRMPDLCLVHPSMLGPVTPKEQGIEVRPNRQVLPNHLWLGIHDVVTT
jgi:hypothetical protein